jgi:hypothetical protein
MKPVRIARVAAITQGRKSRVDNRIAGRIVLSKTYWAGCGRRLALQPVFDAPDLLLDAGRADLRDLLADIAEALEK